MMPTADSQNSDTYQKLAELARANVSGPMGRKLVERAQHDLIASMLQKGLISEEDAADLKM